MKKNYLFQVESELVDKLDVLGNDAESDDSNKQLVNTM